MDWVTCGRRICSEGGHRYEKSLVTIQLLLQDVFTTKAQSHKDTKKIFYFFLCALVSLVSLVVFALL